MKMTELKADDFYRVHDGPHSWSFGRCREHSDEWLVVETFGKGEPRYGWGPRSFTVKYPLSIEGIADAFLAVAEVWP
jgi:hypothetical protein